MCAASVDLQHDNEGRSDNVHENPTTTSTSNKPQHMNEAQRIFIGGLDPPNLTVEMVQKRIKASFEDKMDVLSFHDNSNASSKHINIWGEDSRTFFFLTAKLKSSSSTPSEKEEPSKSITPLELISKQYHKVRWKGCSLQVEPAKLHFLQRLEIERMEAREEQEKEEERRRIIQKRREEEEEKKEKEGQAIEKADTTNAKKRHLRIRKQHGEEAYMVDTKPIKTKDWKETLFTVKKQRMKYQKHVEKLIEFRSEKRTRRNDDVRNGNKSSSNSTGSTGNNLSLQSKVFLNRAVHFHFDDNDVNIGELNSKDRNQRFLPKSETNSSSSDESSMNSNDDDTEGTDSMISEDESNTSIDGDQRVVKTEKVDAAQKSASPKKEEYEWSDSDGDSDSDDDSNYRSKTRSRSISKMSNNFFTQSNHDALDEFASAVQDELTNDNIEKVNFIDEEMEEKVEFSSLEDDVLSNLHLLKKMYPDIDVRSRNGNVDSIEETKRVKPGWNRTGIMQRYDPTADSSTKYEIKDDEIDNLNDDSNIDTRKIDDPNMNDSEEDDDDDDNDDDDSDDGGDSKDLSSESDNNSEEISTDGDEMDQTRDSMNVDSQETKLKPPNTTKGDDGKTQIYEQKKLENIFQQTRSGVGTTNFQLSSLFQFDLKKENEETATPNEKKDNTKNFSFSFDTLNKDKKMIESSMDDDSLTSTGVDHTEPANKDMGQVDKEQDDSPNKRKAELKDRRGLFFPSEDLNIFEKKFFSMNEGVDGIIQMMDDRSKSEADKNQWQEERKTLTLDWKRKLKYAQTKRNKKMKFR